MATTGYARTDGQPSLTLTVTKTSDANTVTVANEVEEVLAEIAAEHPDAITVATVSDLSVFIVESQEGLVREGGLGAIFAIITIFLFLFSLRSTLVAAISIPLSVLSALVLMQVADISLNVMTLGGLAVAVGRVVDDAIVVLENIYRHRAMGEDRLTASIEGPKEVARAITSSTLTTILVFLPIGFVGGLVSQLFLPFALTVTFALLASLIVALTVVPVLAYLFINKVPSNVDEDGEPKNSFWIRVYTPLITGALRNRATKLAVLGVSALLFVASLTLVGQLPTQFINAGSEKILQVTLVPPAGASSQAVLEQAIEAETILIAQPDVETVQTSVPGEGDAGFNTIIAALQGQPANSATITVRLDSDGRPGRGHDFALDGARPGQDGRLRGQRLRGRRLHLQQPQRDRQRQQSRGRRGRPPRPSSAPSTTATIWPTCRATLPRQRPRSRCASIPTRPQPSARPPPRSPARSARC